MTREDFEMIQKSVSVLDKKLYPMGVGMACTLTDGVCVIYFRGAGGAEFQPAVIYKGDSKQDLPNIITMLMAINSSNKVIPKFSLLCLIENTIINILFKSCLILSTY